MEFRAIALCLLAALSGCQSVAPAQLAPAPGQTGPTLNLFQARLRVALAAPRQVQALPDFWDRANILVESARLKAPASSSLSTATSSLAPTMSLPVGPATVSIELRSQGLLMATGSATASLVPGVNPLNITMSPWLDRIVTVAGDGTAGASNGVGVAARFNSPRGLAVDAQGNLYVADTGNNVIRKITPWGSVSTVAGSGIAGYADGTGAGAKFNGPSGVAMDASGSLYVADTFNQRIRRIDPAGNVTTLAGNGATGSINAVGTSATFWDPWGITVDTSGSLYVSDFQTNLIRKITQPSLTVTTFATTSLNGPSGLAIDSANSLIVANYFDSRILKVSPGGTVMPFAGTGTAGFSGDGGPANTAQFNQPRAVAVDASDNVYVADTF
ncbi:MAG TPA: hypothetical protein V6D05_08705, partial [Stenomitos sp.]